MWREHISAVVAAIAVAGFVAYFSTPYHAAPVTQHTATSTSPTLAIVPAPDYGLAPMLNALFGAPAASPEIATSSKQATSTPLKAKRTFPTRPSPLLPITKPRAATTTTKAATTSAQTPTETAPTSASASAASTKVGLLRDAVVNILCISKTGSIHSGSGSGTIVDPRGIILTAAHVAQYFLLQDYPEHNDVRCVIRTGSPAQNAYFAKLIYISPEWIQANPTTLIESAPNGTGMNDFAFLAITGTANNTPLPGSFSYIPLSSTQPSVGDKVSIGTYGAEFLAAQQIESALYPIIVFATISNRYTFNVSTVDLISVDGSAAAQEGSSGGAVMSAENQITGLITTSTITNSITTRTLHAITPSHIRESFKSDTGSDLDAYLAGNSPADLVSSFVNRAATLAKIIERYLN